MMFLEAAWPFPVFAIAHIITGATGLVLFWVPVLGRKGAAAHKKFGRIFAYCLLATGVSAIGMSVCTLVGPVATHPHLDDVVIIRGLFGWMMLYLAILTISLVWHGLIVVRNKAGHGENRRWHHVALQIAVISAALVCAGYGFLFDLALMMGIAIVGVASGITNLVFIFRPLPRRLDYLNEHVKALVGAGISVYTAFLTFGAARLMPQHAFNPYMWATPIVLGISLIVYHQQRIARMSGGRRKSLREAGLAQAGD